MPRDDRVCVDSTTNHPTSARRPPTTNAYRCCCCCCSGLSQIVALFKAGGEGRMPSQDRLATAFREPSAPAIGSDHADSLSLPLGARVHAPVDEGYHLVRSPPHQEPHALPSLRSSLVPQAAQVVRFVRLPGGQAPVVYVPVFLPLRRCNKFMPALLTKFTENRNHRRVGTKGEAPTHHRYWPHAVHEARLASLQERVRLLSCSAPSVAVRRRDLVR